MRKFKYFIKYKHITRKLHITTLLIISTLYFTFAQQGKNPFEISNREVTEEITPTIAPPSNSIQDTTSTAPADPIDRMPEATTSSTHKNPFEVNKTAIPKNAPSTITSINKTDKQATSLNTSPVGPIDKTKTKSFLLIISMTMIVLFTTIITLFRAFVSKVYEAFINNSQLNSIYREMGSTISFPYLILYFMYFVNGAIFLYLLLQLWGKPLDGTWSLLLRFFLVLVLIFSIKHAMLKFLGWVFPISKEIKLYNFTIIIFNILIGVMLIPFNLIIAYAPENLAVGALYLVLFLIVLIYAYRSLRGLLIGSKYFSMHKFHFFMYLCTIELIPLIILVKFVLDLNLM